MKKIPFLLLFVLAFHILTQAQSLPNVQQINIYSNTYRPPGLDWQHFKTPHFNIIFPQGEDSVAYTAGQILEQQYNEVQELVGGSLHDYPVVLNNYNDWSNGYVSPMNSRIEVEIPTIKGKSMNPRSGDWMETVLPHELVHALHINHLPSVGISGLIKPFAPDVARALHTAVPSGVLEGIAVDHETDGVTPYGGRGHYPYFTNQFNSVFDSDQRWSMGQMVQISADSRPLNRHYIGGYEFTNWLQQTYGDSTTRNAIDFYARWPFLGYGIALKHATGKFPGQLYHQFNDTLREQESERLMNISDGTCNHPIQIGLNGKDIHRPVWISDHQILFYGLFYNGRSGFYIYNLQTKKSRLLTETRVVEDYRFDISQDHQKLIYARYKPSAIYDNDFKTDLYEVNLNNGHVQQLTHKQRIFAPEFATKGIWALKTDQYSTDLVHYPSSKTTRTTDHNIHLKSTQFVAVTVNPMNSNQLAVVANRRGLQGLWLVDEDHMERELRGAPDIAFQKGSVFDPAWNPSGDKLLFSSDHTGTINLYEYNLSSKKLIQVTDSRYNAFEGSYAPGGNRIAYILQQKNERIPATLKRNEFFGKTVPHNRWMITRADRKAMNRPELGATDHLSSEQWESKPYHAGLSWLKPRIVAPAANSNTDEIGLQLLSADVLRRNTYSAELTTAHDRFWYDLSYRYSGFYPGFKLSYSSQPLFTYSPDIQQTVLAEDRGFSLKIPVPVVLEQNTRYSSFHFEPEFRFSRVRLFNPNNQPFTNFVNKYTINLFAAFQYRLQQNIRDVQPNTGMVLFAETEHDLATGDPFANDSFSFGRNRGHAFRTGIYSFVSPLRQYNQSLRLGLQFLTQTKYNLFNPENLVSNGFEDPILAGINNAVSFSTRYTIPLFYPDNGGFLIPAYLSNIYLAAFTNTVGNLNQRGANNFFDSTRSVYGGGLHFVFRLSNLSFDVGFGLAYEPTRDNVNYIIGQF